MKKQRAMRKSAISAAHLTAAEGFIKFVNEACTPFHAVKWVKEKLDNCGFTNLSESTNWENVSPGGRYYVIRNETSIVIFSLGGRFNPPNGLKIVGAHTDSPNFSLKPQTSVKSSGSYHRVGVQCYGGGLWHTWFDRDLTVAGRVIVAGDKLERRLIHIKKPILRIPTLAIHLSSIEERKNFSPNKETHLIPIACSHLMAKLNDSDDNSDCIHCGPLFQRIAEELNCDSKDIIDFDLSVVDTQEATIGGLYDEFLFSPRIDNLLSCFCAVEALLHAEGLENDEMGRMICLFDHEEVGSSSSVGAGGSLLTDVIDRLVGSDNLRAVLVANSFLLSVDGAHGIHPNYADKHEMSHRPLLNEGPVIKYNSNVRYATNGVTAAIISMIAQKAQVPLQKFVVKNDSPCGSTIGPILSTLTGIKAVDIGNAQLSMHSAREMCGVLDVLYLSKLLTFFFTNYDNSVI